MYYKVANFNENPFPLSSPWIYFAKEDILAFLDGDKPQLYEVKPLGEIYEVETSPKQYKVEKDKVYLRYIGEIDRKMIEGLLATGANINAGKGVVLVWAATYGKLEILKYLIKCKISFFWGNFSLVKAAEKGHLEVVEFLLEQGANINALNKGALKRAIANGHFKVVTYLLEKGADLSGEEVEIAIKSGHLEIVKYLIKCIDPKRLEQHLVWSVFEKAYDKKWNGIIKLLKQKINKEGL